uniref:Uncharacterized protein n=1 Tax=Anopheles coluzzii TaxID=1518534 RepID=A0A8W7P2J2_ANOCL
MPSFFCSFILFLSERFAINTVPLSRTIVCVGCMLVLFLFFFFVLSPSLGHCVLPVGVSSSPHHHHHHHHHHHRHLSIGARLGSVLAGTATARPSMWVDISRAAFWSYRAIYSERGREITMLHRFSVRSFFLPPKRPHVALEITKNRMNSMERAVLTRVSLPFAVVAPSFRNRRNS